MDYNFSQKQIILIMKMKIKRIKIGWNLNKNYIIKNLKLWLLKSLKKNYIKSIEVSKKKKTLIFIVIIW